MALSKDQAISQYGTEAYTGWGETEAAADAKAKGLTDSSGKLKSTTSSGSTSGTDYSSILKSSQEAAKAAIEPAVEALKSSLTTTQNKYSTLASQAAAGSTSLTERYNSLIDELKSKGTQSEQAQTKVTAGELGKRGIPLTSTLAQQEITNAVQPITSETASNIKSVGLAREDALGSLANTITNLGITGQEAEDAINTAIAQLYSGASSDAVSNALSLYQTNQNAAYNQSAQDLQKLIYNTITLPESTANIANINSQIANRESTSSDSDWLSAILQNILGQGTTSNTSGSLPQAQSFQSIG